jgi:hypothetical protein
MSVAKESRFTVTLVPECETDSLASDWEADLMILEQGGQGHWPRPTAEQGQPKKASSHQRRRRYGVDVDQGQEVRRGWMDARLVGLSEVSSLLSFY